MGPWQSNLVPLVPEPSQWKAYFFSKIYFGVRHVPFRPFLTVTCVVIVGRDKFSPKQMAAFYIDLYSRPCLSVFEV